MTTASRAKALLVAALFVLSGCVAYYPAPSGPSQFDLSWDAAMGAMQDIGAVMGTADRNTGTIIAKKDGAALTANIRHQADGSVRVEFNSRGAVNDTALANQVSQAYQRRMGR